MTERNSKLISTISFAASILVLIQILVILFRGEAACLNQGCKIVENLIAIPPLYFNLVGLFYFQAVCWLFFLARRKGPRLMDLSRLFLLTGVAVESVLIAYQMYVAEAFCSYCLILFAIVLLLNALAGWKQSLAGISILSGIILISSMLSYGPTTLLSKQETINSGTYGTRTCLNPQKELYLFFSADCPHCKNVIQALEGCSSCNFHFNPIEKLDKFELNGMKRTASYDPELNKLLLKLLEIDSIPVLLEKNQSGFSIIKGEKQIIHYIQQACYLANPLLYLNTEGQSSQNPIPVFNEEGECSLNIECDTEGQQKLPADKYPEEALPTH
ncbi:MAG: vitamin K epoxide reductase family protein [Proteobacteria bacterium]|nr:vitamin K epoxide reductase family protein [Desulfocapsa sp.]MBU3943634.1 vitamin K epoxide reductase family protein [Pseudomonadota bacterium]MCG2745826.1 vitamin K epoxide reductase family protein [Desulfobacteraceae bacterium]MBU3983143.1 vitamin K epoxide reductase family protein [Pseudomonadota bacterium]MBU4028700.1 vitamin K epoxide reductase family protein [Pseudomonadota bacterium]